MPRWTIDESGLAAPLRAPDDGADPGGDGLGGENGAAPAVDDPIGQQFADPVMDDVDPLAADPRRGTIDPGGGEEDDPFAALGPEVQEWARQKGWKSLDDMATSGRELERELGRRGAEREDGYESIQQELAELRRQVQEGAPSEVAGPAAADGDLFAPFRLTRNDYDQIVEVADGDPGRVAQVLMEQVITPGLDQVLGAMYQRMSEEFGGALQETTAPMGKMLGDIHWRNEAARLRQTYGGEFDQVAPDAISAMKADPALLRRPDGLEIATERLIARRAAQDRARRARSSEGDTLTGGRKEGGHRRSDGDELESIRRGIASAVPTVADGLSG
jgi:hypothetical protein